MPDEDIQLKQLLEVETASAAPVLEVTPDGMSLRAKLSKELPKLEWASIRDGIVKKVPELLDIKLVDVIAEAWNKYRLLAKYADPNRYPPDETILVSLAEHTVNAELHPSIQILIAEKPVGTIKFDLTLALTLKGLILTIQDAKIEAVRVASCEGKGKFGLEGAVLLEKPFGPFPLSGLINLGKGVSLGPLATAAPAS